MQITPDWLTTDDTRRVFHLLSDAGHQIYAVGGCVRDAVLGRAAADIDLSTDARPERVIDLAAAAGLRTIPTGIEHGTVTVMSGQKPFEVTTFRKDVETDGRRAVVAFSDRLEEDAQRRDFTMNALYLDQAGQITDPVGGLPDLAARRIRFIGDATARIREDYLRTLRFFRFHAWFAGAESGFEAEDLAAIADTLDGLTSLSKERVTSEVLKLLSAPEPAPAVATMVQINVLTLLLPGIDAAGLAPLIHIEDGLAPDPIRRLAALGQIDVSDLRLSKADARRFADIRSAALDGDAPAALGYRLGAEGARDAVLVRAALMAQPLSPGTLDDIARGAAAVFPVKAADLMPRLDGAALGRALSALEARWIASNFALTRAELLTED